MKKILLIALTSLPLFAQAGLLDAVTGAVSDSTKEMALGAADSYTNDAVQTALGIKSGVSTKESIKEKFGAPTSTGTEDKVELWNYDLSTLNESSPTLAQTTKTLLPDANLDNKNVVIRFEGETVKSLRVADKPKA
ncbi:hypothetical protein [Aeromonas rivuli]|uniref:hypothetical protein n=1 Tax=Aeromonas rivuli TaxID=648794 RepID=UPI001CCA4446|nr:hypothetical protein [Aeromonas rivuli]UBO74369.1 hypothetical protein KYK33_01820 [Aeromonas rivuli]